MKKRQIVLFITIMLLCTMLTSCSEGATGFFDTIFSIFPEGSVVREFIDNFEFPAFCVDAFNFLAEQFTNTINLIASTNFQDPAAILLMIVQIPLWLIILALILVVLVLATAIDVVIAILIPVAVILICIAYLVILLISLFIA